MIGLLNLNALKLNLGRLDLRRGLAGRSQARSSLLGIALDGHRFDAILLHRVDGSVRAHQTVSASLELNLLTDDPELVGREMRNHLDKAGIHERYCSVCLPLEWALSAHLPLPDLPEEDVESFLNLEAERSFPFAPDSLSIITSVCRGSDGSRFATLIAIPKDHLTTLQKVFKSAQLKPVSFSLGMPALQDPAEPSSDGVAALGVGENSVELMVCAGGGISALRALQGALEQDGARKKPYVDVVARDLRITLGQMPASLRQTVRRLRVFGNGEDINRFADDLNARAKLIGLDVSLARQFGPNELGLQTPPNMPVSPAVSLAGRILAGRVPQLEFLPPRVSRWKQLSARYSSKKLVTAGVAAGVVLLMVLAAFLFQQWQLGHWRTRWNQMRTQVGELETMQQQIRQFRPWFDESYRSLTILQKITEAFPDDGSVTAKSLEIRDGGVVSCSGTTQDQQALFKVVDQLRASKQFSSVQVDQIRGKQFTVNLQWSEGGAP